MPGNPREKTDTYLWVCEWLATASYGWLASIAKADSPGLIDSPGLARSMPEVNEN